MSWEFEPYQHYGPLVFGMTRAQIEGILGPPSEAISLQDKFGHLLDPSLYTAEDIDERKRSLMVTWPDSETNNQRPGVMFFDDQLVSVHLAQRSDSLTIAGVDVWQKDRIAVILALAKGEEVMLFSGADYYFESLGVRITAPKFWKRNGSIGLYSKKGFELEMNTAGPAEYGPEEITGKES